jgi:hypothetical protein
MQWQDRLGFHSFLFFARPCGVKPQAAGTAIAGVDSAQLGALMVAQSAARRRCGTQCGWRYENFHFGCIWVLLLNSIPITLRSVERLNVAMTARTLTDALISFVRRPTDWEAHGTWRKHRERP